MNRSPRPATRVLVVVALTLVVAFATATPAFAAMSRSLVMFRAEKWVAQRIPYSQSVYRTLDGQAVGMSTGWRTDCSGFTSMAWNTFRPGYSTRTLQQTSTAITKEELRPGDALVSYNYHAVIFGGWADEAHTRFYRYQMGTEYTDGDGTSMREVDYSRYSPTSENPYIPYRLNGIGDYVDYPSYIESVQGVNRYETAVSASRSAFATGTVDTVIIASGENWPDALGASALAGVVGGPVLLTHPAKFPVEVRDEIARLGAHNVIVVGGPPAVSDDVLLAIDALESIEATRLSGADRYATAARVAEETVRRLDAAGGYDGTVFVTTGANFPDALAASPLAAKSGWPILLTKSDTLGPETAAALSSTGATRAIVLGSTNAVGAPIETELVTALGPDHVIRLAGSNRYGTAIKVAGYGITNCGLGVSGVAISTGENFPDALAGGVMAAKTGTVLLLTPTGWLDGSVEDLLVARAAEVGKPRVLGGPLAVTPMAREAIALALGAVAQ